MAEKKEMNKDQEIADAIMGVLGRIPFPIYAGTELQLSVDINQWLDKIVKGEVVLSEANTVTEISKNQSV